MCLVEYVFHCLISTIINNVNVLVKAVAVLNYNGFTQKFLRKYVNYKTCISILFIFVYCVIKTFRTQLYKYIPHYQFRHFQIVVFCFVSFEISL